MSETTKAATSDDPEALKQDIADKRRELGDTAAALAAKADVKSQVSERVERVSAQARRASPPDPRLAAAVAALILLLVLRRRRR